ncbi:hypothetical protein J6590_091513 [Homalodisca vitripennis]|nr:hypothetical protein J6590_091513 [Homalodisca vitripennis]
MILNIYSLISNFNSQQVLSYGRAERTFIIASDRCEECEGIFQRCGYLEVSSATLEALDTRALHFALTARLLSSCLGISF